VLDVHHPAGVDFIGYGPIVVERFHVSDHHADEFDAWMGTMALERATSWPGITRIRTFRAAADIPQRWPYLRYQGKGNRMIWADFRVGASAREVATSDPVLESLAESVGWDTRLTYVSREVGECLLVRTKADIGT
jgi:hypothetical protein